MKEIVSAVYDAAMCNSFGVEIETSGLSDREIMQIVAAALPCGELHPDSHRAVCVDGRGRTWKAVRDSSIRGEKTAELVTPVLCGEADLALLCDVVAALKAAGVVHCSSEFGCGVHVHVGAAGHTAKSLLRLYKTVVARQQLLFAAVGVTAGRSTYCEGFGDADAFLARAKKAERADDMELLKAAWYGQYSDADANARGVDCCVDRHYDQSRYHLLNLHAVFSKGTVEFRLFQWHDAEDELNPVDVRSWVTLALCLNQVALSKSKASAKTPAADSENPAFAMRTWLVNGLGLNGAQFAEVRRALGRRLGGNSAWRHCGKAYACGQSPVAVRETLPHAFAC